MSYYMSIIFQMYKDKNLLDAPSSNFSNYANWVLTTLFTYDELRQGIVEYKKVDKREKTRQLLDRERVGLLKSMLYILFSLY